MQVAKALQSCSQAVNMMSDMTFTTSDHPGRLRFQHPLTGFEFDVGEESDADKNDDFEGGVCYRVIHLGNAAKVRRDAG